MIEDIVNQLRDRAYSGVGVDRLCEAAADEIVRLRLTDAERRVVKGLAGVLLDLSEDFSGRHRKSLVHHSATLRGLLDRLA